MCLLPGFSQMNSAYIKTAGFATLGVDSAEPIYLDQDGKRICAPTKKGNAGINFSTP